MVNWMTSSANQIIGLYRRHAQSWVLACGPKLREKIWLDLFLALIPEARTVLDVGCGAGDPIARYLTECGADVTGIDASPELIAIATQRFANDKWIVADMRALKLPDRFDAIIAWDSFFHLTPDDQRLTFPVFRQHAVAGCALLFTSGTSLGEAIGEFEGEPLYHGSLDEAEYRQLLETHGFEVIQHIVEDPECGGHTVWLARLTDTP